MKISGFTFLRNASKLYYPFKESILSVLPLVDEFIIMLGAGDENDHTQVVIQSIESPKIKIFHSVWNISEYPGGTEYAHQTDLAKEKCSGDWLIYLQGDEVIHEDDYDTIHTACVTHLSNLKVEGFVLDYLHFWGDYDHYFRNHTWYKKEIRIIRNLPDIHSWRDAQSFRWIPDFDAQDYRRKKNTRVLNCIGLHARIFHYGWVRPPSMMATKNVEALANYSDKLLSPHPKGFDYGRMDRTKVFEGSHPAVMSDKMKALNWQDELRYSGPMAINRPKMKHEKWKYRVLSYVEENILGGKVIGGFKNYRLLQ
jgi:hypothetical protein